MKLGVFDSGLGGLLIAKAIRQELPDVDILYYGDTLHVPYGSRSRQTIIELTKKALHAMFAQDCQLIIVACNTASAAALRYLQQNWVHEVWPGRNVIGVVVPTLEEAADRQLNHLAVIGTNYIVSSNIYAEELKKINPQMDITQIATPLLVPLIENNGMKWAEDILTDYLAPLQNDKPDALLLGCTHYPRLKNIIRTVVDDDIEVLSQDEIIPHKLKDYLIRHPEYDEQISKNGESTFFVSELTESYQNSAEHIWGEPITIQTMGKK